MKALKALALVLMLLTVGFGSTDTASADGILLPIITVEPGSYDFGVVPIGAVAPGYLMVHNGGDVPLVVDAVKTKAPFLDGARSFTVPAHSSRRVTIGFAPTAPVSYSSFCTFQSNAANAPVLHVPLSGWGEE